MFILYAIVIGLVVGRALGGRIDGLADLRIRWAPLIVIGLAVQIALFSTPLTDRVGDLGPMIYVGSTAAVVAAILANRRLRGMLLLAIGAFSNLAAIVANGGYMPADPGAMASLAKGAPTTYSNSAILADPALRPLTDIFALPSWLPFANVFSLGDILIGIGLAFVLVTAMRSGHGPRQVVAPVH